MIPWSTLITGIVGLAGIGGTIVSAKMAGSAATRNVQLTISADDKRAYVAEKRRIYAKALTAVNEATIAAVGYRVARQTDDQEERQSAIARQLRAVEGMHQDIGELALIAPHDVAGNAIAMQHTVSYYIEASQQGPPFTGPAMSAVGAVRDNLLRSMRIDLGEPIDIPDHADSVPSPTDT